MQKRKVERIKKDYPKQKMLRCYLNASIWCKTPIKTEFLYTSGLTFAASVKNITKETIQPITTYG
jgi:hypothetical protein